VRSLTPVDVPADSWLAEVRQARDGGFTYLDHLTVIDRQGSWQMVVHLVNLDQAERVLMTTTVGDGRSEADSITPLFPGANWHEREAAEMFGIAFVGHPDPRPLLTRAPITRAPMSRATPLPARTQTPWPGAPADDAARAAGRRRNRVPGVLESWGDGTS
jgi:NADH-quinone oxidoreductase subunit C